MWSKVTQYLRGHPERLQVAKALIENGLCVKEGEIYCNKISIQPVKIGRAIGIDRRTVLETVKTIEENQELRKIFEGIKPSGPSLKGVAKFLNLGVVEITPEDARTPGILAKSATILADKNISIRQAIVDDPELSPEPKLTLIADTEIPGELVTALLKIRGVERVSIS